jgi:hypothetical protein
MVMSRRSLASRLRTTRRATAAVLTLLLMIQTTGCTTWRPSTQPVPKLQSAKPTDSFRFTLASGERIALTHVQIRGDSVLGQAESRRVVRGEAVFTQVPAGFPLTQVTRIERRAVNAGGIIGSIVFVGGVLAIVMVSDNSLFTNLYLGS